MAAGRIMDPNLTPSPSRTRTGGGSTRCARSAGVISYTGRTVTLVGGKSMSKVEHIEQQIQQLSRSEFLELRDWILERDWESWDAQVAEDARAGKLDELVEESREDYRAGRSREL
jgi:hypothetical protein